MNHEQTPDEIQERMNVLRSSLDFNVEQIATTAKVKSDWRYYIRNYPWLSIGAAATAGYLLVPRRVEKVVPEPDALAKLAKEEKLVVAPKSPTTDKKGGAMDKLLAIALAAGTRAAIGFVSGKLGGAVGKATSSEENTPEADFNLQAN